MKEEKTYAEYVKYCTEAYDRGFDPSYILHNMLGWSHEEIRRFSDEGRFEPKKGMSTRYKAANVESKSEGNSDYKYLVIG